MTGWTRLDDADGAAALPAWFAGRMTGEERGAFGLLLATGDVLRVAAIAAIHRGADGTILLDVRLGHAGVPQDADLAWQGKHYLGAPVPGAVMATVNLAQVVAAVEFAPPAAVSPVVVDLREAAEAAAERGAVA